VFPQLADVRIDYQWGGMIGIGANRLPQIGRLASQPNVYYAQAYSGHGVNATHLAGRLLAEAISGQQRAFRPVRQGAAHHLPRRQAPALAAAGAGDAVASAQELV
jgi:glycine/D-amino acid oxidase-like deaminating enzyme